MPAISTTSSGRPSAAAKDTARYVDYEHAAHLRPARDASAGGEARLLWRPRLVAGIPERRRHPPTSLARPRRARVSNTRARPIGKVDDETGHLWSLMAHVYEADGEFTRACSASSTSAGHCRCRIPRSGCARGAGFSSGDRDDPLANAYFGGFRNNYVDNGDAKRYREFLSMPGFEIDALNGKSFAKSMLEWNLPPLRFDISATPAFTRAGCGRLCSRRRW